MKKIMVSVIIPLQNQGGTVWQMTEKLKKEAPESAELILVDRGSSDDTVFRALTALTREGLHGCVLQSGRGSTMAAACQAGLSRAEGEFVCFLSHAERLPDGYLQACLEKATAQDDIEMAFGYFYEGGTYTDPNTPQDDAPCRQGIDYLPAVFSGAFPLQMVQVLFRTDFLRQKSVYFHGECACGFDEEFLYTALLRASRVQPVNWKLSVLKPCGLETATAAQCLQRVEALLRVRDLADCTGSENLHMQQIMQKQVLPAAVMEYVDRMLDEGKSPFEVRRELYRQGLNRYMRPGHETVPMLRRRVKAFCSPFQAYRKKEK